MPCHRRSGGCRVPPGQLRDYQILQPFPNTSRQLLADQFCGIAGAVALGDATVGRASEETGRGDIGELGSRLATVRIDRALGRGADRELEALQRAVAELD